MRNDHLTGMPSIDKPWLQYYSDEAIHAELPMCSAYDVIWEENKNHLDEIAIAFMDKEITYYEVFQNINKAVKAFYNYGVKQQEIVSVCIPNIPEAVYIFYALNRIGAICNLVDPRANESVMVEHLKLTECRLLITIPECYDLFKSIRERAGLETLVILNVAESIMPFCASHALLSPDKTWHRFLSDSKDVEVVLNQHRETKLPICVMHTGGTTGVPKGALLTDENFHSLVMQWKYLGLPYIRGNSLLSLMPPVASFGLTANMHVPLCFGMKLIMIPEYNPANVVEQIIKYKPNCVPASPAHWETIYNDNEIRKVDLSFLKAPFMGGDILNPIIEEGLNEVFSKYSSDVRMINAYGMTESTTAISIPFNNETNLPGSVGIPLPQTVIGIFDEDNNELSYGKIGEICVRSKNVMLGYYKNDETKNTLLLHEDGLTWLHTGDLGLITENGILYIKGRKKRMIIRYDGLKVYPADVEAKLMENKYIKKCAVVSAKDPNHLQGSVPVAFIVSRDLGISETVLEKRIKEYSNNNIFDYAVPYQYYFIEDLPYTKNGKVDVQLLERKTSESI